MEGDIFVNTAKDKSVTEHSEADNFFMNQSRDFIKQSPIPEPLRHLNDYDSNILKDEAYQDVTDEVLKLEYKISRTEDEIKNLESQIHAAMSIGDDSLTGNLYSQKYKKEYELRCLLETYRETGLSARISGGLTTKLKNEVLNIKKNIMSAAEKLISVFSGKFSSLIEVKSSLSRLSDINKSVDELMADKYPAWESNERYDRLSKYILKANAIQSDISRVIK